MWLLVLLAHWVSVAYVAGVAFGWIRRSSVLKRGAPNLLVHYMDHNGFVCGNAGKSKVRGKPYVYFPNPPGRRSLGSNGAPAVADASFDDAVSYYAVVSGPHAGELASSLYAICVSDCPKANHERVEDRTACAGESCDAWESYASVTLGYYCVPHEQTFDRVEWALTGNVNIRWLQRRVGDVVVAIVPIAVSSTVAAFALGFLVLYLIQIPGALALLVWLAILVLFLALILVGFLAASYRSELREVDDDEARRETRPIERAARVASYACWVAAALFLCFVCCLRRSVQISLGVIKEAARCVLDLKPLPLVPLLQAATLLVLIAPWAACCAHVAAAGERNSVDREDGVALPMPYTTYTSTDAQFYVGWYLVFDAIWTQQFIFALGELVVSLAASTWYFSRDRRALRGVVSNSVCCALFYHAGTAALGSLLIALLETARKILAYVQTTLDRALQRSGRCCSVGGCVRRVANCAFCCVRCCLWCLSRCLRFINRNAYIQTAIRGLPFCPAAKNAFFLLLRDVGRVAALHAVGYFVFTVLELMIAGCCGLLCFWWLSTYYTQECNDIIFPTLLCTLVAYACARCFVSVVDVVSDTILMSFLVDQEIALERNTEPFAPPSLRAFVEKHGQVADDGDAENELHRDSARRHTDTAV